MCYSVSCHLHFPCIPFVSSEIRSAVVEQSLRKLGVERLGKEDVQKMQWEVLEAKIGNWIHFMRISVSAASLSNFDMILAFCFTL